MLKNARRLGKGLLLGFAVASLVVACSSGGSHKTAAPGKTMAGGSEGGLSGAASNFDKIKSYKFNETLEGDLFSSMTGLLGGASASSAEGLVISGTVISDPEKAADVTMMGMHIIEIGGYSYMDMGELGWTKSKVEGEGMADSFSPSKMFSSYASEGLDSYHKVGSEQKNGVQADHYQADASSFGTYGSMLGVSGDVTWSADIWVAQDGGYPVSVLILATDKSNKTSFKMSLDLTNINDPNNKVTAPTNVMDS